MKVTAYIHSLQDKKTGQHNSDKAEILEHIDNNHVIAEYRGVKCRTIYNPFVGAYFVDDVYGKFIYEK